MQAPFHTMLPLNGLHRHKQITAALSSQLPEIARTNGALLRNQPTTAYMNLNITVIGFLPPLRKLDIISRSAAVFKPVR